MNKLIKLDHEHNKRSVNLIIFGIRKEMLDILSLMSTVDVMICC
jgi:hypothetical protein